MTDRGRADLLADLHRELLEHEARLRSLLEQRPARERLGEPSASTAPRAPTAPTARTGDEISLTERDVQILQLVVRGHTNREIGAQLQVDPATIRNHLSRIYLKLGVMTRTHAAVRTVELGLSRAGPAGDS